jgi:enamine deaminase RidA (YjgF/YER057c/UK114 family)
MRIPVVHPTKAAGNVSDFLRNDRIAIAEQIGMAKAKVETLYGSMGRRVMSWEFVLDCLDEHVSNEKISLARSGVVHMRLDVLLLSSFLSSTTTVPNVTKRKGSSFESIHHCMSGQIEQRLNELGIQLPPAPKAAANYAPAVREGNLLFLSGHMPLKEDGTLMTGRLGETNEDDAVEYGYRAARQVGLNLIATMKDQLGGDLDKVEQIVKLFGIVQSTHDFHEQHKVLNGREGLSTVVVVVVSRTNTTL